MEELKNRYFKKLINNPSGDYIKHILIFINTTFLYEKKYIWRNKHYIFRLIINNNNYVYVLYLENYRIL